MRPCKHCGTNLDGGLVIQSFLDQNYSAEKAIETAKMYSGWEERGLLNRWGREIGQYDMYSDRTAFYVCPDCGGKV